MWLKRFYINNLALSLRAGASEIKFVWATPRPYNKAAPILIFLINVVPTMSTCNDSATYKWLTVVSIAELWKQNDKKGVISGAYADMLCVPWIMHSLYLSEKLHKDQTLFRKGKLLEVALAQHTLEMPIYSLFIIVGRHSIIYFHMGLNLCQPKICTNTPFFCLSDHEDHITLIS